ncbi:MAG: hypothetical protein Q8O89_06130 [Nanoarchaeota archaeon]|nr:hypothetical protein [Nanoarchaeota archaeon]
MTLDHDTKQKIKSALESFYAERPSLLDFELKEECMNFRIAHHLQNLFGNDYYVDCEYNREYNLSGYTAKKIADGDEFIVDMIVHKRNRDVRVHDDYLCFEIKKWKEKDKNRLKRDREVLEVLTGSTGKFSYHHGFHIILGNKLKDTKIMMFERGKKTTEDYVLFTDFFKDEE